MIDQKNVERFQRAEEAEESRRFEPRKRPAPIIVEYVFAVYGQAKPPEIQETRFRIGDIVYSTHVHPVRYRVVEVYWLKADKARVLLREEPEKKRPNWKSAKKPQSAKRKSPPRA